MADKRLYNAAAKGDERTLDELLQEDPLVLDTVSYTSPNKTPLHIATIRGHLPFVEDILNHNPHLAEELDSQHSSALHIASAKGYVEIVKKLLSAAPDMCMSRDSQGRNPLHLAAIKGHVQVLEELFRVAPFVAPDMCMSRDSQGRNPLHLAAITGHVQVLEELFRVAPFAAREKLDGGLSLLHLCVKYSQVEALKILMPKMKELLNSKDDDGDTILHMAAKDKQIEVINFLLNMDALEVNALNHKGMTAVDVLSESRRDARDSEIKELLKCAGGLGTSKNSLFKQQHEWLEKKRSALMVVASLLATIAFQVGVNPPGGIWQEDSQENQASDTQPTGTLDSLGIQSLFDPHQAGASIMAQKDPGLYKSVSFFNTTSLITSLSIILLLMSGLPIRRRLFMWILMVIVWIAISATAVTYIYALSFFMRPLQYYGTLFDLISYSVYLWISMMGLLAISHTIRLTVKLVKKLRITFMRKRRIAAGSTVLVDNVGA